MAIRRACFPSARGLAGVLWVLQNGGYVTRLGMLEAGPVGVGGASQELESQALLWAGRLGASQATGLATLDFDAPELAGLPALQTYLRDRRRELSAWLDTVFPEDEGRNALPTLMENLRSLKRRRGYDPESETFLVVPARQMRSFRIGPADYVLTRDLVNTRDVFRRWARQRHRMTQEPISSVSAAGCEAGDQSPAPMPNSSSASITLDRYSVSAACALSQPTTAGLGSGRIASETTLVPRTITAASVAPRMRGHRHGPTGDERSRRSTCRWSTTSSTYGEDADRRHTVAAS